MLLPTLGSDVYLLVRPPRNIRHDSHKTIQIQQVVTSTDDSGNDVTRIRPILNLEYHRLFHTRIIELECSDSKIAELIPSRGGTISGRDRNRDGGTRMKSRGSISGPLAGRNGGSIKTASGARQPGAYDMTITGSESQGEMSFSWRDEPLTWRKADEGGWKLDSAEVRFGAHVAGSRSRTSYEWTGTKHSSAHSPSHHHNHNLNHHHQQPLSTTVNCSTTPTLSRVGTESSQYTTMFENESLLSQATHTPTIGTRGPSLDLGNGFETLDEKQEDNRGETYISDHPLPHLRVFHPPKAQAALYRILISALWLAWSCTGIVAAGDDEDTLADRASETANSDERAVGTTKIAKSKRENKGGFMSKIARMCSSGAS